MTTRRTGRSLSAGQGWPVDVVRSLPGGGVEGKPPDEVVRLAQERQDARKRKDFKASDEARDRIKALGWSVEDTKDGAKFRKL